MLLINLFVIFDVLVYSSILSLKVIYKQGIIVIVSFAFGPLYFLYGQGQKTASIAISDGSSEISYSSQRTECGFAKGTKVLMFNSQIQKVENLKVGDLLMGDDSNPRTVVRLTKQYDDLYEITPTFGDKYMVSFNQNLYMKLYKGWVDKISSKNPFRAHYMDRESLKVKSKSYPTRESAQAYLNQLTDEDLIVNVQARTLSQLTHSNLRRMQQQRSGVEFQLGSQEVDFDPYIMGVWLCKGNLQNMQLRNLRDQVYDYVDKVINLKWVEQRKQKGTILSNFDLNPSNLMVKKLLQTISTSNSDEQQIILDKYKINSKQIRMQVFAGMLDSIAVRNEQNNFYFLQLKKKKDIANDILYLARSLGYTAYAVDYLGKEKSKSSSKILFKAIYISGQDVENIPVKALDLSYTQFRKQRNTSSQTLKLSYKGINDSYNIAFAEKGQFLLQDFTVVQGDVA